MLTHDTVQRIEEHDQVMVKNDLRTLARSGVFKLQIELDQRRIVESFANESAEKIAKDIVDIRNSHRTLLGLHNLGMQLSEGEVS